MDVRKLRVLSIRPQYQIIEHFLYSGTICMFKVQDEKFTVNAILYDDINLVLSISREMQDMPDTSVEALRSKPYDFTLEKRGWQWQLCVTINDKDQVIILVE